MICFWNVSFYVETKTPQELHQNIHMKVNNVSVQLLVEAALGEITGFSHLGFDSKLCRLDLGGLFCICDQLHQKYTFIFSPPKKLWMLPDLLPLCQLPPFDIHRLQFPNFTYEFPLEV